MVVTVLANTLATLVLAHGAWWTILSCLAIPRPGAMANERARRQPTMVVVVPAHNEEVHIARTVASLTDAAVRYGPARILVVADNCEDATAFVARHAGAEVVERNDGERRGKHFALAFAIERLASTSPPDIVAFVDADSTVSPSFCEAIAAALSGSTSAVQIHYATDPTDDEDTSLHRLRRVAFALSHWSRQLGASRLGLGTGIKGNGMAVRWNVAAAGLGGEGVTEDAAMTLSLAGRGIRVRFVPGATVWGQMAGHYSSARTQDTRWEGGRFALVPRAIRIGALELGKGRVPTAAAAAEVASLPLSLLVAGGGLALVVAGAGFASFLLAVTACASLLTYVAAGLVAARVPWRDAAALVSAPRFLLYKATVYARILVRGQPRDWERTSRTTPDQ